MPTQQRTQPSFPKIPVTSSTKIRDCDTFPGKENPATRPGRGCDQTDAPVDSFRDMRLIKAFPCKYETAQIVKKIIEKFFPKFRVSDNGSAFVAQVTQGMSKYLEVEWKLHCVY